MAHRTDLLSAIQGEIGDRIAALRPLLAEYEQLLAAMQALDADEPSAAGPPAAPTRGRRPGGRVSSPASPASLAAGQASGSGRARTPARVSPGPGRTRTAGLPAGGERKPRAGRGAAREAILAALEHGSHTVAELVTVTAMSAANISGNVRRLLAEGAISKAGREGKAAYVLAGSEAQAA